MLLDAAGGELQRIDLTRLSSASSVRKLLRLLGFREACADTQEDCATWAAKGECDVNPAFMHESCRKSCRQCTATAADDASCHDRNKDCAYWAANGECDSNPAFMTGECPKACGRCGGGAKDEL